MCLATITAQAYSCFSAARALPDLHHLRYNKLFDTFVTEETLLI